jgi:peptidyl-dipeptidase A
MTQVAVGNFWFVGVLVHCQSIGLVNAQEQSNEALINAQMRMALAKVSFMPFGLMIDR